MPLPAPHLSVDGIAFRYGSASILEAVDLRAERGERLGILGASGVGKSTFLQILAGLVSPSDGEVHIDGKSVRGPVPDCTVMFQRPALLPWASVLDNVLLPARLSGRFALERATETAEAQRLLREVGLGDREAAKPHELSGGQQQRVALARALASAPQILLLDEPFSALDPEMRGALRADVLKLARERGLTLVIVTHDLADVAALAERAVFLGGRPAGIVEDFRLGSDAEAELRRRAGAANRSDVARAAS